MVVENEIILRTDNDTAWKEILRRYLKDFVDFFWIEAYQGIDWEKPYDVLEQELIALGFKNMKLIKNMLTNYLKYF